MFEVDINAQVSNVTVKSKTVTAAVRISLPSGLIDQLISYLGKDLKLRHKESGYELLIHFTGGSYSVHADATASTGFTIRRKPGVVDWLLDLDDEEYFDYVLAVDHAQAPLSAVTDDTDDDARPSAAALAEAEDDGIRRYTATPSPASV